MIKLYDTYKKELIEFESLKKNKVGLYTCGPTVYDHIHIGNFRTFIFYDILKRVLKFNGYKISHVLNITDVGHLTSDEDAGEDKLEKGARRENLSAKQIAEKYTTKFLEDFKSLNLEEPDKLPQATNHIKEMIKIVKALHKKGFAYETKQAVYFDISQYKKYEELTNQELSEKITASREEVVSDSEKKHPADFALWFKAIGRFKNHQMRWPSPWGEGFPGWHIECSAMSAKYLGKTFDIHTGGIDHISIHHPNEMAQSESAFSKNMANYWLHSEFLLVEGQKMSKSLGNLYTFDDLRKKGLTPLDFKYLVLTTHYQNKLNFTWEGIEASSRAFDNLKNHIKRWPKASKVSSEYLDRFKQALNNNLDTPQALAIVWEIIKDENLDSGIKKATINKMDQALGLNLSNLKAAEIPSKIIALAKERDQLRNENKWTEADSLRKQIETAGYLIEDTETGSKIYEK